MLRNGTKNAMVFLSRTVRAVQVQSQWQVLQAGAVVIAE